jgi:hypothetical protein
MVTPMQDPQEFEGPDGTVYVREGNRYRVVRPGQPAAPAAPAAQGFTIQPMETSADRRAEDDRAYRRQRDTVSDSREERRLELAEQAAARAERSAGTDGDTAKQRRALQNAERSYRIVREDIARALELADGWTTGVPGIVGRQIPGTEARDLEALMETIRSNIGFEYLGAMREASPTGGALGNVSNIENALLQATSGNLDVGQSLDQLRRNLERIDGLVLRSFSQAINQYEANGGTWDGLRPAEPARPGADASSAIDYRDPDSREALVALIAEGGWIRDGDGDPYYVGPGGIQTGAPQAGDEQTAPGVAMRPQDAAARNETAAQRSETGGIGRRADAFVRGAADAMTFGFSDEIAAGLDTVIPLNQGRTGWQYGFGDAYQYNLARERGVMDADAQDLPVTRGAGQVAGALVAPGAMAGGRAIAAAPSMLSATGRGAGVGAMAGGAYGAGSAEGPLSSRAQGAQQGAMTGAMAGGVLGGGGRAVGGAVGRMMTSPRSQAVQTLRDNGVSLTPGQQMGGLLGTVENLAQRAPILGPAIRGARERGVESLNRAVGNRALDAIGDGVPINVQPGGEMVGHVRDRLGAEFDRAYAMVPQFTPDEPLMQGLGRIGQAKTDLPPAMQEQFDAIIGERLARLGGDVTGQQVGSIRTELSGLAAGYLRSQDPAQQGLGRMLVQVSDELDGAIGRASPEAGNLLSQARDGYADYIRLERASTAAGGRPFSPGQLESAVRASDGSVRRGAVGRNDARMQDLSSAARMVMPDQFGNPGTADAVGLGGLAVGAVTEPVTTTAIAAGLGAAATPYLMMGRRVIERLPPNASRQQLEAAAQELDGLSRQDSNVIVLRDEIARRIARTVPAAAQMAAPEQRLMTGTPPR